MGYQLVKEGSYTYKRVGKRKLSYRVIFRQGGVHLDELLERSKKDHKIIANDRDAVKAARERISEATGESAFRASEMVKIRALGNEVIENKITPSTKKDAKFWIHSRLLPWFDIHCPFISDFNEAVWDDYIAFEQRNRPGAKLFNCRKYMSQIQKRAKKKKLIPSTFELRNPDPKRKSGKVYTEEEVARLLSHAQGELFLQILMAYGMGMRKTEILGLKKVRIDFERGYITLTPQDTKIRQGRTFSVPQMILDLLKVQCERSKGVYVFPSRTRPGRPTLANQTAWENCKEKAKVTGRFHDLRHTDITREVVVLKRNLAHVSITRGVSVEVLMKVYLHPTPKDTAYIAEEADPSLRKLCGKFVANFSGVVK